MCGIVAILSRPATRPVPGVADVLDPLDRAIAALCDGMAGAAAHAEVSDRLLRGVPGVRALVGNPQLSAGIAARLDQLEAAANAQERHLEAADVPGSDLEAANAELIRLRDVVWALRNDRLRTAREVAGGWRLDGRKPLVGGALFANAFLVFAKESE